MAHRGPKKVVLEDGTVTWVKSDGSPAKKPGRQTTAAVSAPTQAPKKVVLKDPPKIVAPPIKKIELDIPADSEQMVMIPAALLTRMLNILEVNRKERALDALENLETRMSLLGGLDEDGQEQLKLIRSKIIEYRLKILGNEEEEVENTELQNHAACPVPTKVEAPKPKAVGKTEAVGMILNYIHQIPEDAGKTAIRIFAEKVYQDSKYSDLKEHPFQIVVFVDAKHEPLNDLPVLEAMAPLLESLNGCVTFIVDGKIDVNAIDNWADNHRYNYGIALYTTVLEFNLPPEVEVFTPAQIQPDTTHPLFYMPKQVNLYDDEVVVIM